MAPEHGDGDFTYYPAYCNKVSPTYFTWVKLDAVDVHSLRQRRGFEGMYLHCFELKHQYKSRSILFFIGSNTSRHLGQNLFYRKNHPIQFICLAGIIVSREEQERRTILVLDDSSGLTIEVTCSKHLPERDAYGNIIINENLLPQPTTTPTDSNKTTNSTPPAQHIAAKTKTPLDITPLVVGAVAKLKGTITTFRNLHQLHLERYNILPDTNAEVKFWEEKSRFLVDVLSVPWKLTGEEVEQLRKKSIYTEEKMRKRKAMRREELENRERKKAEKEERDRVRIEKRYAKEEAARERARLNLL